MLEVILGSMYAQKSTELIRRVKRHQLAGKKCAVYKHSLDAQRNESDNIITHDKASLAATPIKGVEEIDINGVEVIAIDECQFFDEGIIEFVKQAGRDKRIILAGLDMDYNGNPFGYMGALCCLADEVVKLHAVCVRCGKDAKYSYRKTSDKEIISVGAKEKYEALCEECYWRTR